MTEDVISRKAALNTKYQIKEINGVEYVMLSEVQMKIRKLPSVKSIKRYQTIKHIKLDMCEDLIWYCPNCRAYDYHYANIINFCPNCGADMRGGF